MSGRKRPAADRFWEKVIVSDEGCWIWVAGKNNMGYGKFNPTCDTRVYAHRWAYEQANGPIPDGLEIDHLCRTPACVRPDHMEAVTHRENILRSRAPMAAHARKTHCPQGHPYDDKNTYLRKEGGRGCRACGNERNKQRYQVFKAAATALGMSVPTYIDLHGKSMRKAMQIAGQPQQEEREAVV